MPSSDLVPPSVPRRGLAQGKAGASGPHLFGPSAAFRLRQLEEELRQTQSGVLCGLSQLLDLKDLSTGCHSTRLAEWAVRVAVELGLDEHYQRNVEVGCLLHDIGKVGVPDAILQKAGPLTLDERDAMNKHPEYGWTVLRLLPGLELASLFALHHHERLDGAGYPGGLKGDKIPLGARIVTVVDAFDAMISDRRYRKGLPLEEALRRLNADAGRQFDTDVVAAFVRLAPLDLGDVVRIQEPLSLRPPAASR